MKYLLALALVLMGCGSDNGGDNAKDTDKVKSSSQNSPKPADNQITSIALETKDDLPACEALNDTQLAYIMDLDIFYVCKSLDWKLVAIKGEDGKNGTNGSNGSDGISSNSSNLWHDSITGYNWLLGGPGTAWTAATSCSNGYREPTNNEGLDAALHGIRSIASLLSLNLEFWTGIANDASYIGLTNGSASIKAGITSEARSIFCVKE